MDELRSVVEGVLRGQSPAGAVQRAQGPEPALVLAPEQLLVWFGEEEL